MYHLPGGGAHLGWSREHVDLERRARCWATRPDPTGRVRARGHARAGCGWRRWWGWRRWPGWCSANSTDPRPCRRWTRPGGGASTIRSTRRWRWRRRRTAACGWALPPEGCCAGMRTGMATRGILTAAGRTATSATWWWAVTARCGRLWALPFGSRIGWCAATARGGHRLAGRLLRDGRRCRLAVGR